MDPVERVRAFLAPFPDKIEIMEFAASTKTAAEAARTVGVEVGQIAKTILFLVGDEQVLVVTCGDLKVSQSKLKKHLGLQGKVRIPDAHSATEITGFPPGGVCPFALPHPLHILIDVSMRRYPVVYIAAGSPHSAAPVTVEQLLAITGGSCVTCAVFPRPPAERPDPSEPDRGDCREAGRLCHLSHTYLRLVSE
jgi:prolyl-tRNA editing enzyme YbaK/EbsC (Cys-tRNA(Pro) deacylase)